MHSCAFYAGQVHVYAIWMTDRFWGRAKDFFISFSLSNFAKRECIANAFLKRPYIYIYRVCDLAVEIETRASEQLGSWSFVISAPKFKLFKGINEGMIFNNIVVNYFFKNYLRHTKEMKSFNWKCDKGHVVG